MSFVAACAGTWIAVSAVLLPHREMPRTSLDFTFVSRNRPPFHSHSNQQELCDDTSHSHSVRRTQRAVLGVNTSNSQRKMSARPSTPSTATSEDVPSQDLQPEDRTAHHPDFALPNELWTTILATPCTFPSSIFDTVMLNLVHNPNLTSPHLFRADIFYDSGDLRDDILESKRKLLKHLKAEYQPWPFDVPHGYELRRTMVRQLVPRNPQRDHAMMQTCYFLACAAADEKAERNAVVYLPHITSADCMPFYHPPVRALAFLHCSASSSTHISISCTPFPPSPLPSDPKLVRTVLSLLSTTHKHGQGLLGGYTKRVNHDALIPQRAYQDTYARLKARYGRDLSEKWVEVTDPGKHVFEDLGIAAFLIELWQQMYVFPGKEEEGGGKEMWPGFVDLGCGNGVLTYILLSEGYTGWGFDARTRKTWSIFPDTVQALLQQRVLVPSLLQSGSSTDRNEMWHDGDFDKGTFIISNHADELTAWTPLLAYLCQGKFVAIPCCSHDLSGARARLPSAVKTLSALVVEGMFTDLVPSQALSTAGRQENKQAAETGSLARPAGKHKMPSAYATLCSYTASLASSLHYVPEMEILRIPSTRNTCIVGRRRDGAHRDSSIEQRESAVKALVEKETGRNISEVGVEWMKRAQGLTQKPGSGH